VYHDRTLSCRDCNQNFVFTTGEQEFFASRGFTNEPSRCPECRAHRKQSQGGSYSGGYERPQRQMYPAVCSQCGKDTQVPFQPRTDKPVYCSDCFEVQRGNSYAGSGGRNRF
jgi:CxxC-x17-CxxC domain-containing protein